MKEIYIYDLETYKNIFCAIFLNIKNNDIYIFEISDRLNEFEELKQFLKQDISLVGYNNMAFDYPVLHNILEKDNITSNEIHLIANEIINNEFSTIWNPKIPQLDLFLIHHYNNSARRCSLKWLEFSLRWEKVQDLPYKPDSNLLINKFDEIIEYCINDVKFTKKIYDNSINNINFRKNMSKKLNHNVMNYSDVKIGEYINQITYEKLSNKQYFNFKNNRTYHKYFKLDDIIPKDIKFKSKIFNEFFDSIKNKSFKVGEEFDRIISLSNISIKFAKGGLHSEDKPRIVKNTKGYLSELDIGSMYPWSIVSMNIYPKHLGSEWNEGIKQTYFYRANELKPKLKQLKKGTKEYQEIDDEQEAYKLALNGGKI